MSFYRQSAKNLIFQIINLGPFLPQITTGEAYLVYTNRLRSNSPFNQYLSALYKVVGTYLFGAAISQSLTDLAKFTIGRPRPNFIDVCKPVVCNGYMLEIKCNGSHRNVTESRWTLYDTYQICYRVQCKELGVNGWFEKCHEFSSFWMCELLNLFLRLSPATVRRKLILAACITLWVITGISFWLRSRWTGKSKALPFGLAYYFFITAEAASVLNPFSHHSWIRSQDVSWFEAASLLKPQLTDSLV